MRRSFLAVIALLAVVCGSCFPHNPKARKIAYGVELGVVVGGIAVLAFSKPGIDCDQDDSSCRDKANILSLIGVVLLLGGIAGLVATVSTAEDAENEAAKAKKIEEATPPPTATPAPAPAAAPATPTPAEPTGAGDGSGSGSGSGPGSGSGSGSVP